MKYSNIYNKAFSTGTVYSHGYNYKSKFIYDVFISKT